MWNADIVAERLSFSSDIWVEKVSAGVILQYIREYRDTLDQGDDGFMFDLKAIKKLLFN